MKIFVTRKIPGEALNDLKNSGHEVVISKFDRALTQEELVKGVEGYDALLTLLTDRIDGDLMDAAGPQLKVISNYAVGFDNIDVKAASDRKIVVANTPSDEVNESVAEHTWALILTLTRRIVEADEATRRGAYKGWEPEVFLGHTLKGKTLGIIGMGRIGKMVAKRALGFEMQVLYFNRSRDEETEKSLGVIYSTLEDLVSKADVISLHVPLTEETRHLINAGLLSKAKRGALLVNTARGPIVDEHDMVDSLRSGVLGGVGLDVYEDEPNINPELIGMENVVLTPHIASGTYEAREKMTRQAADNILNALAGKKPENMVNEEVWDTRRK